MTIYKPRDYVDRIYIKNVNQATRNITENKGNSRKLSPEADE